MKILVDQAPGFFLYDASVLVVPKSQSRDASNVNYPFMTFFSPIKLGASRH